jgi:D-aminoacyl-tRNA deacylase
MAVLIVSSTEDPAGTNITQHLQKQVSWNEIDTFKDNPVFQHTTMKNVYLATITDRTIYHDHLDIQIQELLGITLQQIIFASRHSSKMGKPTLTVHPIGNYGDAAFGGQPQTLVPASPHLMTALLRSIKKNTTEQLLPHQVCFEVTHHGPLLHTPTLFAEVGSTDEEWQKQKPAKVIATSILETLQLFYTNPHLIDTIPVLVGIGGGHYAPRFTDVVLEKNVSFGHMIPQYHLESDQNTEDIFTNALHQTPGVSGIYLHRKSLKKSQINEYKQWFNTQEIPVVSSTELPSFG